MIYDGRRAFTCFFVLRVLFFAFIIPAILHKMLSCRRETVLQGAL